VVAVDGRVGDFARGEDVDEFEDGLGMRISFCVRLMRWRGLLIAHLALSLR
jgi:hypothetical protein